jgi:hypothetical protein
VKIEYLVVFSFLILVDAAFVFGEEIACFLHRRIYKVEARLAARNEKRAKKEE